MQTIKLRINDSVYERIIWLLGKFNKDEVEIIPEDAAFRETQIYLETKLHEIMQGKADFVDLDIANERPEKIIRKNEDRP